eukprot:3542049-Pyramimonas_sp.AAC.1
MVRKRRSFVKESSEIVRNRRTGEVTIRKCPVFRPHVYSLVLQHVSERIPPVRLRDSSGGEELPNVRRCRRACAQRSVLLTMPGLGRYAARAAIKCYSNSQSDSVGHASDAGPAEAFGHEVSRGQDHAGEDGQLASFTRHLVVRGSTERRGSRRSVGSKALALPVVYNFAIAMQKGALRGLRGCARRAGCSRNS